MSTERQLFLVCALAREAARLRHATDENASLVAAIRPLLPRITRPLALREVGKPGEHTSCYDGRRGIAVSDYAPAYRVRSERSSSYGTFRSDHTLWLDQHGVFFRTVVQGEWHTDAGTYDLRTIVLDEAMTARQAERHATLEWGGIVHLVGLSLRNDLDVEEVVNNLHMYGPSKRTPLDAPLAPGACIFRGIGS